MTDFHFPDWLYRFIFLALPSPLDLAAARQLAALGALIRRGPGR